MQDSIAGAKAEGAERPLSATSSHKLDPISHHSERLLSGTRTFMMTQRLGQLNNRFAL